MAQNSEIKIDCVGSSGISYSSSRDSTMAGVIEIKSLIRLLLVTLHTEYEVPLLVVNKNYCSLELTMCVFFLKISLTAQYKVRSRSCTRIFFLPN